MAYKRAARVAFFSSDGALANIAVRTAGNSGAGWLVATAIACDGLKMGDAIERRSAAHGQDAWRRQDLLVSLDQSAKSLLAEWAPPVPARHYGVDELAPADQARAIEQRVKSMIAGMRMLARSSC